MRQVVRLIVAWLCLASGLAQPITAHLLGTFPAGFTKFDPATATGNVGFTNGNLTLSASSPSCGAANTCGAHSVSGQSGGLLYATFTFTLAGGANFNDGVGVVNSGASLDTCANSSGTGCAVWSSRGGVFINGSTACISAICGTWTNGDEIDVALDKGNSRVWFRKNHAGNWNGSALADPVSNVGGFDISALNASLFVFAALANSTGGTHEGPVTGNFGTTPLAGLPIGYTGWPGP